jgi:hypothetical protein
MALNAAKLLEMGRKTEQVQSIKTMQLNQTRVDAAAKVLL